MISAPSHPQPLNGSKFLLLLFLVSAFSSCALFRKAPADERPTTKAEEENLDPLPGRKIYDPETGTLVIVEETPTEPMDTVKWRNISIDSIPPIQSGEAMTQEPQSGNPSELIERGDFGTEFYTAYNVVAMLPFLSDGFSASSASLPRNSTWALNYYGGMLMALDELDDEGIKLNVKIMDSKASSQAVDRLLNTRSELFAAHLILGAYRSENVERIAEFARRNNITYVSPHSAAALSSQPNPNLVQVSPTLESHCQAITRHARKHYSRKKIVLVGRERDAEQARFTFFQEENVRLEGRRADTLRLREYAVPESNEDFSNIRLDAYVNPGDTSVFILPSWSSETFIYAFLSQAKLAKASSNCHIVVYGMPQWQQYERIDLDLYEDLNVHISHDTYLDSYSTDVQFFQQRFFERYGTLPGKEAALGYDVMRYMGRMLKKHGTKFQYALEREARQMLHTRFDFERVVRATTTAVENPPIQRFENKHVNILRFQDYQFQSVN